MTRVSTRLGFTMNLGDFQSARVDIGVEDDLRDGEGINDAFERVYSFVEKKLIEKQEELQKELGG